MNFQKRKKRRLKKKYKNFFIIYLLLVTIVTGQYSLSKLASTFSKNDKISVATPIVNLIGEDINKIELVEESDYVYSAEYEFSVTNNYNDKINEVTMQYFIEIELGDEFTYLLYKNEVADENLISDVENYSAILGHSEKEEHKYILKIIYEPIKESASYETNFDVNVLYVQMK